MARIRTIKPEFWEDEVVGLLSMGARLLFIGSWNLADDEGLLRWSPEYLKASLFMYDHAISVEDVKGWMGEVEEEGLVFAYVAGKARQRLGWVVKFHRHQRINRPQPGRLPPPSLQNPAVRRMYAYRDNWTCHICGKNIESDPTKVGREDSASVDHVTPRATGGSDYPTNIRVAHLRCNKGKRDKDLDQYVSGSVNDSVSDSVSGAVPEGNGREQGVGKGTESISHTHRAKGDENQNGTSGSGSISLADFLGPHQHVLKDCPPVKSERARRSVVSWYGPDGMHTGVWKIPSGGSVPAEERPRILAMALTGYAGEGKDKIVTREFDGMLRGLVRTEFDVEKPPGSSDRALTTEEREAYKRIRSELEADGMGADEAAEKAMTLARGAAA